MAFPTAVNSQITDSITQPNTKVLGDAPSVATGNVYIATSQALSNSAHNATVSQRETWATSQASNSQGIANILTLDTASIGKATQAIEGVKGLH